MKPGLTRATRSVRSGKKCGRAVHLLTTKFGGDRRCEWFRQRNTALQAAGNTHLRPRDSARHNAIRGGDPARCVPDFRCRKRALRPGRLSQSRTIRTDQERTTQSRLRRRRACLRRSRAGAIGGQGPHRPAAPGLCHESRRRGAAAEFAGSVLIRVPTDPA